MAINPIHALFTCFFLFCRVKRRRFLSSGGFVGGDHILSLELRDEVLQNGVRVISEKQPTANSASIGFWANVGSRDEGEPLWGASHFLEHMLFKGTETRTSQEISSIIENKGGYLNAFTDRDMTAYHARILKRDLSLSTLVLGDLIQNSLIKETDMDLERQVILEEIKRFQDDPSSLIHALYLSNIWRDNPLAHPILGTTETITEMSQESLREYFHRHYDPKNLVVIAAGAVDHEKLVDDVEKSLTKGLGKSTRKRMKPKHFPGKKYVKKDTEQVQLSIATEGFSYNHKDIAAQTILSSYLGMGSSSILFQEVREKKGLVYAIYIHNQALQDVGTFGVFAGTRKENLKQVIEIILKELEKSKQGLDPETLETVKHKTVGFVILSSESNRQRMNQLGTSTLRSGNPRTLEHIVNRLEAVTNEDIMRVADMLFDRNKLAITTLGLTSEEAEGLNSLI